MNLLIWATWATTELHGDSQTLSDLAHEGTHGVEIAMIAALVILSCFFFWVISHREAKREKDTIGLEIERNKTLGDLTNAIKEYSFIADRKLEMLRDDVADVAEDVKDLHSDVDTMRSVVDTIDNKVESHGHRIDDAERLLSVHDQAIVNLDNLSRRKKGGGDERQRQA